jgi:hypothetical protein
MPNGQIHDDIADSYLKQFDQSLSVSAMKKLRKFPMLQELGYNGSLSHFKETFHGLKEWNVHMGIYSKSHPILTAAWNLIKNLAPKNPFVELLMFRSPSLGKVGLLFKSIHNFDKVFGLKSDELLDLTKINAKVKATPNIV